MRPDPDRFKLVNPQCEEGAREPRVLRIAATWQAACLQRGAAGQRQLGCGRVWLRLQIQIGDDLASLVTLQEEQCLEAAGARG